MISNFVSIRWYNPNNKIWTTDYINVSDTDYCVIWVKDKSTKFNFCIDKQLANDVYTLLNDIINDLLKDPKELKIINLGLHSHDKFVTGQFDIINKERESE